MRITAKLVAHTPGNAKLTMNVNGDLTDGYLTDYRGTLEVEVAILPCVPVFFSPTLVSQTSGRKPWATPRRRRGRASELIDRCLAGSSDGVAVHQVCSSRAARDRQSLSQVASHGFRAIAHDRRGHRRSSQPWDGNDPDTYADDLAELIEALDLRDVGLTPQLATARFTPLGYRIDRG